MKVDGVVTQGCGSTGSSKDVVLPTFKIEYSTSARDLSKFARFPDFPLFRFTWELYQITVLSPRGRTAICNRPLGVGIAIQAAETVHLVCFWRWKTQANPTSHATVPGPVKCLF
jgi:hypothetical protein